MKKGPEFLKKFQMLRRRKNAAQEVISRLDEKIRKEERAACRMIQDSLLDNPELEKLIAEIDIASLVATGKTHIRVTPEMCHGLKQSRPTTITRLQCFKKLWGAKVQVRQARLKAPIVTISLV